MRVAIIQSSYLPWRGYFDVLQSVDLFIALDDVQYTARDWRNRNRIKTPRGAAWITVPVTHDRSTRIEDAAIDHARPWARDHRRSVALNYARAPYVDDVLALLAPAYDAGHPTISALNVALLRAVAAYLGITTPIRLSSEFAPAGARTERLLSLLTAAGARTYVSGPSARAYLDEGRLSAAGIQVEYKRYAYEPYPQQWGAFDGSLSVIDLVANCGPDARHWITSLAPNERAA